MASALVHIDELVISVEETEGLDERQVLQWLQHCAADLRDRLDRSPRHTPPTTSDIERLLAEVFAHPFPDRIDGEAR